jgi:hypothetical protein
VIRLALAAGIVQIANTTWLFGERHLIDPALALKSE